MTDSAPGLIVLIYFGQKGGGLHLTKTLHELYSSNNLQTTVLMSSRRDLEEFVSDSIVNVGDFSVQHFIRTAGFGTCLSIIKALKWIRSIRNHNAKVIWVMSHPFDALLRVYSEKMKIENISIIHEYVRHRGEVWPPRIVNDFILKHSNSTIVMSSFVRTEIQNIHPNAKVYVLKHPTMHLSSIKSNNDKYREEKAGLSFLFIGRIREYKGVELLIESWKVFKNNPNSENCQLVIAGQGKLGTKIRDLRDISIHNRWLKEDEIIAFIRAADVVVLPYSSASQSGILSLSEMQSKVKIVFESGGIPEQLDSSTILVKDKSVTGLVDAMKTVAKEFQNINQHARANAHDNDWRRSWLGIIC